MTTQIVLDAAKAYIGLAEFPGAKHNPKILEMFKDTGNDWVADDETPWCAAFVGSVLAQCGMQGTGKLNARSYLDWGTKVDLKDAKPGDVVVFSRGNSPTQGHVAFFDGWLNNSKINVVGGNQGDAVTRQAYPVSRVLGVRRAIPDKPTRTSPAQSTTVQASAVQISTAVGGGVAAVGALDGNAQIVALILVGVVIVTAAWIMRERLRKWAKGIR